MHDDITDIPGIRVGHDTNLEAATGCTVILCDTLAVGGVDVRGGAPATRETDLLRPMNLVEEVNAVVLTGGSAFGLDAASGVMRTWKSGALAMTQVSRACQSSRQRLSSISPLVLPASDRMQQPATARANRPRLMP